MIVVVTERVFHTIIVSANTALRQEIHTQWASIKNCLLLLKGFSTLVAYIVRDITRKITGWFCNCETDDLTEWKISFSSFDVQTIFLVFLAHSIIVTCYQYENLFLCVIFGLLAAWVSILCRMVWIVNFYFQILWDYAWNQMSGGGDVVWRVWYQHHYHQIEQFIVFFCVLRKFYLCPPCPWNCIKFLCCMLTCLV